MPQDLVGFTPQDYPAQETLPTPGIQDRGYALNSLQGDIQGQQMPTLSNGPQGGYVQPETPLNKPRFDPDPAKLTPPKPLEFSLGEKFMAVNGGFQVGKAIRQYKIDQSYRPLLEEYSTKLNKALNSGNLDIAEALNSQLSQLPDLAPHAQELLKRGLDKTDKIRTNIQGNQSIADVVAQQLGDRKTPETEQAFATLQRAQAVLSPEQFHKLASDFYPQLFNTEGGITAASKSGKILGSEAVPTFNTLKDIPNEVKDAFNANLPRLRQIGIDSLAEYTDLLNKAKTSKLTPIEQKVFNNANAGLDPVTKNFVASKYLSQAERIKMGISNEDALNEQGVPNGQQAKAPNFNPQSLLNPNPQQQTYIDVGTALAKKLGVPENLVRAVMHQESGYGTNNGPSSANAMGPMQITPNTAQTLSQQMNKAFNTNKYTADKILKDHATNIEAGVFYLSQLLKSSNGDPAVAAGKYFSGPDSDLSGPKTRQYIQDVAQKYQVLSQGGSQVSNGSQGLSLRAPQSSVAPVPTLPIQPQAGATQGAYNGPQVSTGNPLTAQYQATQAEQERLKTEALNRENLHSKEAPEANIYYKFDKSTGEYVQEGRPLANEELKDYAKTSRPKSEDYFRSYANLRSDGQSSLDALKNLPQNEKTPSFLAAINDSFNKALATGIAVPVPFSGSTINVAKFGTVTLSPTQAQLYNALTAFGASFEEVFNPDKNKSSQFEAIKKSMTGALGSASTAENAVRSILDLAQRRAESDTRSKNPNAVIEGNEPTKDQRLPRSNEIGAQPVNKIPSVVGPANTVQEMQNFNTSTTPTIGNISSDIFNRFTGSASDEYARRQRLSTPQGPIDKDAASKIRGFK
jgi:soluble lytic murein transglycosylase-like protein